MRVFPRAEGESVGQDTVYFAMGSSIVSRFEWLKMFGMEHGLIYEIF